ncbi:MULTISPECIES: HigA family addiction module antitoxin [Empedobacter]|uniref:Addiction module antidote protein, HigA family n=1 Tax=Empedobacter falsenii TaxID=343874 RepID=A0A427BET3_9FLAO|nr:MULTISPECIES: HigA family addiction module antitoxin [Empedobacter]MDH0675592.1 HigA family addiction module antitoxin [Empedobacter sp. GD03861]RRT86367.1 addiction module antidote protein, HigA family [Empedobacter falsenii]RRT87428.1 addiction module antidote protein, HigA family [Empedobacter falsenii]
MTTKRSKELNVHPSDILKDLLENEKLSISNFSKLLNISRVTMYKVINKRGSITPNLAIRIAYVFGGNPDFWLRLQRKYDLINAEKGR